ncbi:hypothetical protein [Micromonospora narathiwatensis]|uniref:hypothetical protein n=1 Tax=Micromonospora narathiwatensis TaxID=299146 RepID=UPI0012FE0980|nr:hypothetical protein [Micromonospora narathiwatensis]
MDIWLSVGDGDRPEVCVSYVAEQPWCRVLVDDFVFDSVEIDYVPELVGKVFAQDIEVHSRRRLSKTELRLEVVVEAEKFVAQVRRSGARIAGWEARALVDGVS